MACLMFVTDMAVFLCKILANVLLLYYYYFFNSGLMILTLILAEF